MKAIPHGNFVKKFSSREVKAIPHGNFVKKFSSREGFM